MFGVGDEGIGDRLAVSDEGSS